MRKLILTLLIISVVFNSAQMALQILNHQLHPPVMALHMLGDKFKGLESVLGTQRKVGYVTDKNMEEVLAVAQFEQAQYLLAPTVLDLNQTHYPFVLVDCSSPEAAQQKIKEFGLKPIKANNQGIILTVNPQLQSVNP